MKPAQAFHYWIRIRRHKPRGILLLDPDQATQTYGHFITGSGPDDTNLGGISLLDPDQVIQNLGGISSPDPDQVTQNLGGISSLDPDQAT